MELRKLTTKEEMLNNFELLKEVYPGISFEDYSNELDSMLPHNYGQVGVFEAETCIGMTGFWIGTKLWCGKYLELDNVVISKKHRSKGIGQKLFSFMEGMAEEEDCNLMALDSYSDNFAAHKFFYSQGFVPRGFHFINVLNDKAIR